MTTPKHDIVRLRLTTLEKQDWSAAAGGTRKLSEWIRSVCNEAAQRDRGKPLLPGSPARIRGGVTSPQVPNAQPSVVKDAIARSIETEAPGTIKTTKLAPPAVPPPLPRGEQCPRWMHHRKGVYCGSCKRVTT